MTKEKRYLTIGEAANRLGVSVMTLRRWDKSGKLCAIKRPSGHRYYEREALERFQEDILALGKRWVSAETPIDIPDTYYSDTQDRFRARLEKMAKTIHGEQNLISLITAVAGEIGNNSFDHNLGNWPDIPGIFFSYNEKSKIIVLVDRGLGIKATLKRVREDIVDDYDALKIAMTEQITQRAPERRGNGLKFVAGVAQKYPIGISLQSGTAIARIGKEENSKLEIRLAKNNINGVLAILEY